LIILTDQNFAPVLPSTQGRCPAIIRMEDGSLGELGDSLCTLLGEFTLPEGSIIAISSMSHLQRVGLTCYADKLVSECRRFRNLLQGRAVVVPFTPLPLCGTSDRNLIRMLIDFSLYLDTFLGSSTKEYNAAVRNYITGCVLDDTVSYSFVQSGLGLPFNFLDHDQRLFICSPHAALPGSLPPISADAEAALISPLFQGLSAKYGLALDLSPTVGRVDNDTTSTSNTAAVPIALVVGGSNAGKLSSAFISMGIAISSIVSPGWFILAANVSTLLPSITEHLSGLDRTTPVVLYMLDNSSFKCADADGELSAIQKCADNKYHVVGQLVVTPEQSMAAVILNLCKIIEVCGTRRVLVMTPVPRYINGSCCGSDEHCTHRADPEAGLRICCSLHRLVAHLRLQLRDYPNCTVVCTGDIIAEKQNAAPSDVLAASITGWGTVHGSIASYNKIGKAIAGLLRTSASFKRPRADLTDGRSANQRSRSNSFSAVQRHQGGEAAGSSGLISYPIHRGRGRGGSSHSYY